METGTKVLIGVGAAAALSAIVYFGFIRKAEEVVEGTSGGGGEGTTSPEEKPKIVVDKVVKKLDGYWAKLSNGKEVKVVIGIDKKPFIVDPNDSTQKMSIAIVGTTRGGNADGSRSWSNATGYIC